MGQAPGGHSLGCTRGGWAHPGPLGPSPLPSQAPRPPAFHMPLPPRAARLPRQSLPRGVPGNPAIPLCPLGAGGNEEARPRLGPLGVGGGGNRPDSPPGLVLASVL